METKVQWLQDKVSNSGSLAGKERIVEYFRNYAEPIEDKPDIFERNKVDLDEILGDPEELFTTKISVTEWEQYKARVDKYEREHLETYGDEKPTNAAETLDELNNRYQWDKTTTTEQTKNSEQYRLYL